MESTDFKAFSKIPRLSRDCVITEKIDGTNAQIVITDDGQVIAGKRTSYITSQNDNFGFAKWVEDNAEELKKLGVGRHYGEWYGAGIQRRYGLDHRRFTLFHAPKNGEIPSCVHGTVPVLYEGPFDTALIEKVLAGLVVNGSVVVPGFMKPEGIVVYHKASGQRFKKVIEGDEVPKGGINENPRQA